MSRQLFTSSDVAQFPPSSHPAVANTLTRTELWVPALWTPIPAMDPQPGKVYLCRAFGTISTTGTPTMIFQATFGQNTSPGSNKLICSSNTITLGTLSSIGWYAEVMVGIQALGMTAGTSSFIGSGFVTFGGAAGAVSQQVALTSNAVTTMDHSAAQGIVMDVTWGTASASNTITCQGTLLQALN